MEPQGRGKGGTAMNYLIKEARELASKATEGPWQESYFVDKPRYADWSVTQKEYANKYESLAVRGPGVVGSSECNRVFAFQPDVLLGDKAFVIRSRTLIPELCDALERAEEQNKQLMHEVCRLACESVERDKAMAKLEAEVMAIREAMASVHKSLDFADAQRQSSKNYTELAINNGLALGRIAVALKHDFKQPLPAPPEEGAEHE
jgi:hypothetical protein